MLKKILRSQSTLTGHIERGKGILTLDNVVMAYPEMPTVAHEFGTSFEIMEFLATQQIKVSQYMVDD